MGATQTAHALYYGLTLGRLVRLHYGTCTVRMLLWLYRFLPLPVFRLWVIEAPEGVVLEGSSDEEEARRIVDNDGVVAERLRAMC